MSARRPKCGKKSHTTSGTSPRAMFCHAERREQREIREKRQASEARRRQLRGGL
jgi:hypothetical protein